MYLNHIIVYGNLTRDPELRALPAGGSVASFSLATNRTYKKSDGEKAEQVEYHNVVVFGKQAESCAQYLHKGATALIQGRLQTRSWDKDGSKQYRTEIVAETVQFGPRGGTPSPNAQNTPSEGRGHKDDHGADEAGFQQSSAKPAQNAEPRYSGIDYPQEDITPDDIPF
jgi:single-strand DNA-binding protein